MTYFSYNFMDSGHHHTFLNNDAYRPVWVGDLGTG